MIFKFRSRGFQSLLWIMAMILGADALSGTAAPNSALRITAAGKTTIVLPAQTIPAEETAAQELQHYLSQITGSDCRIISENAEVAPGGAVIYVGQTQFAQKNLRGGKTFADEEWAMQTVGSALILTGGRPRGTLYSVYHFLEDVAGVRWWNPWEEFVPRLGVLPVPQLDKRSQPAFNYRDIYSLYGHDGGRFAARSRINRDGDAAMEAKYGGSRAYGPPYHVHTFFLYLPPAEYFKEHPDWYSTNTGGVPTQLNLSNPDMRAEVLRKLKEYIRSSREAARKAGQPAPEVFSISHQDNLDGFNSPADKALSEREGSQAAPLLDFINYLADSIKDEFPGVYLDTLAYQITEPLPKTIRPRDNVIIRLTNTTSNSLEPLTAPRNKVFHDLVKTWGAAAKNLRVWEYHVNYSSTNELPYPSAQNYGADYRYMLANNVTGIFTEFEYPEYSDLRDFKLWIMVKQLEDPTLEYSRLAKTFTDGFYGAAGPDVLAYVKLLEAAARTHSADVMWWMPSLADHNYLTVDFYLEANRLFDAAAKKVAADEVLSRRVRYARLSLDRSALILAPRLRNEWEKTGKSAASFPFDFPGISQRYIQTRMEQAKIRLPAAAQDDEIAKVQEETRSLLVQANAVRPAKFRDVPFDSLHDVLPLTANLFIKSIQRVEDPESEVGLAVKRVFTEDDYPKYELPFQTGFYDRKNKVFFEKGTQITAELLKGPGYHWVKLGTYTINNRDKDSPYVYFFKTWEIQFPVNDAFDPKKPADQKYDVWASIKGTGPKVGGNAGTENALYIDRVVVIDAS
jgi:hypothetical protein